MPKQNGKLDQSDRQILNILQDDGRITNAKLSKDLGMSPSPMLERVRKLEKNGYIKKYVALIDGKRVNRGTIAIVSVSLAIHQPGIVDSFVEHISKLNEVLECYHISGENDFLLKVVVSGIDEYRDWVLNKLTPLEGINKIQTSFALRTVKHTTKIDACE